MESRQEVGGQRRQVAHPMTPATSYSPAHLHTPRNTHPLRGTSPSMLFNTLHPVRRPTPTVVCSRPLLPNNGQHPPQPTPARAMGG